MAEKDEKTLKPHWPPRRFDKQPGGKQMFGYKGFCALCGTYSRRNLTRADYLDPVGQYRTSGLVCADCFAEVAESEGDIDPDDEGNAAAV